MAVVEKERLKCTGVRQVRDRVLDRLTRAEAPPGTKTEFLHVVTVPSPERLYVTAPSPARSAPYSPPPPQPQPQPQPPPTEALVLPPGREVVPVPEALRPEACPFDLEVATPYAVDLRRLCELNGTKMPPEVEAKLGASVPVLIYHRMTPFAQAGERSHGILGLGYSVRPTGLPSATTVDLVPGTKLATFVSTRFRIAARPARLGRAGRVGTSTGGESASKGVTGLKLRVTTWICESGFLGGPATRWTFARTFPVSLEGLGG